MSCCFKTSSRSSLGSQKDFSSLMLGPFGDQGLILEWWIQASNLGTVAAVGVAKITVCEPSQTGSNKHLVPMVKWERLVILGLGVGKLSED